MDHNHPALVAARNSWRCVQSKEKEEWLSLMSDDILFEDPIGIAPTNPEGKGVRGKVNLGQFWDQMMAPATIRIEVHESFAAGNESAHRMTLRTTFPGAPTAVVDGIFTYRIDDDGKLTNLRGYWATEDMKMEK